MAFFPSRRSAAILAVLTGLMAGLGYFTWGYAEGGSYFSNEPAACANCHIMRDYLDSWQKSSHKNVATCNDCHVPHDLLPKLIVKGENGIRHSWKFTFRTYPERLQITPMNLGALQENCVGCHGGFVAEIMINTRHETFRDRNCVHCHNGVGHGANF